MPFARPEHEVLRLVAMTDPDWERLRSLLSGGLDWDYMRQAALLHQLDGVLAWRCLDERLADACPEAVREDCEGYQQRLAEMNGDWPAEVEAVLSRLQAYGVRYVVFRGPVTYALYGMGDAWPRVLNHIDVVTHPDDYEAAASAAESMGRDPAVRNWSAPWQSVGGIGASFFCSLFTIPPGYDYVHGECLWDRRFVESRRRCRLIGGVEAWVPEPSRHFAALAYSTLADLSFVPERLTVNNLARLHNLSRQEGFSWETVWQHLRVTFSESLEPSFTYGPHRAERLREHPDPVIRGDGPLQLGCDEAVGAAWTISRVAEVYDIEAEALARAQAILAVQEPYFPAFDPDYYEESPHRDGNPIRDQVVYHLVCKWGSLPPLEQFLFAQPEPVTTRGRIDSGLYQVLARRAQTFAGEDFLSTRRRA